MQSILADAGPLIALFRAKDPHFSEVSRFVLGNRLPLVTTWPVVTEVCHFINAEAKAKLLTWIRRGGLRLHDIVGDDLAALEHQIAKYGERMDLADASLVCLGHKLRISDIITIDRNDFSVYRAHNDAPFRNLLTEF